MYTVFHLMIDNFIPACWGQGTFSFRRSTKEFLGDFAKVFQFFKFKNLDWSILDSHLPVRKSGLSRITFNSTCPGKNLPF